MELVPSRLATYIPTAALIIPTAATFILRAMSIAAKATPIILMLPLVLIMSPATVIISTAMPMPSTIPIPPDQSGHRSIAGPAAPERKPVATTEAAATGMVMASYSGGRFTG